MNEIRGVFVFCGLGDLWARWRWFVDGRFVGAGMTEWDWGGTDGTLGDEVEC
jgi:hypothetical protein